MAKQKAAKKSSKKGIAIAAAALVAVGAFVPSEEEEVPENVAGTEVVIQDETSIPTEDEIIIEEDEIIIEEDDVEVPEVTPAPPKAPVSKPVENPSTSAFSYVASDDSDKYHYPSCRWAKEINKENLISFSSVDEAKAAGYVSCGTCHPK